MKFEKKILGAMPKGKPKRAESKEVAPKDPQVIEKLKAIRRK